MNILNCYLTGTAITHSPSDLQQSNFTGKITAVQTEAFNNRSSDK